MKSVLILLFIACLTYGIQGSPCRTKGSSHPILVIGPVPWITVNLEDFSVIPSNSSIPDPGLDYYFHKNGGYSVCKVINGKMYLCDSYKKWCISYSGSGLQWKLEKDMKLEVTRYLPSDAISPGDEPRWFIHGGHDSIWPDRKYRGIVEVWAPESGNWKIDANYTSPKPNDIGCIVVIDGKILQVGGGTVDESTGKGIYTNRVFLGDVEVASMKRERIYHDCAIFKNRVWVAGGNGYTSATSHTVEIYDYESDVWTSGPRIPDVAFEGKLRVIKGDLYFICRNCEKIFRLIKNKDVYTWKAVADIPKHSGFIAEVMEIHH